jgi:hypothetical protein
MDKIQAILSQKNVTEGELPKAIQKAIQNSIKHYNDWEQAKNALTENSTDDEKNEVDELAISIQEFNESISDSIDDYLEYLKEQEEEERENQKAKLDADAKAKKEAEEKSKQETPKPVEEKKSSKGWMIFGALALVVTLGAVNVMNKD